MQIVNLSECIIKTANSLHSGNIKIKLDIPYDTIYVKMNKELSDKYIAQMKNCTWEGDHEDADILICQFLEEIGYQDLADAYRKVPKWFS